MEEIKSTAELLQQKLALKKVNCFKNFEVKYSDEITKYCDQYISFMNLSKTEREFTTASIALLKENGFSEFVVGKEYKSGDKIYFNNRNKSLIATIFGALPLAEGANIMAAHIDSPRLDLKPNPLYEDNELCYFKTHYYGGIKKYQWVTIPLAIHGTVILADGSSVDIVVGEDESDPVFCVTDILPHLSYRVQDDRKARDVIKGEELNILLGSKPFADEKISEPVKLNILNILNEKYGIIEADFISAEFEIVPAFKARYIGFDKSLIGAYAHDDRVCAYTAITAFIDNPKPQKTSICILADKEEIGSDGNTGLASDLLRNHLALLSKSCKCELEVLIHNSRALSADVNAAYDPSFAEVNERRNCAFLNYGPVLTKYTGARGKNSTNDASAEFVGELRRLFDANEIPWQTGELGKVDEGGGGTVAKYISNLGMEVLDIGVALLSMHSPYEIASRVDIYAMYKAFCAFCN